MSNSNSNFNQWKDQVDAFHREAKYTESLQYIDERLQYESLDQEQQLFLTSLKGNTFNQMEAFDKAVELLDPIIQDDNIKQRYPCIYTDLYCDCIHGKFRCGQDYTKHVLKDLAEVAGIIETIDTNSRPNSYLATKYKYTNLAGRIHFYLGKYQQAHQFFSESLEFANDLNQHLVVESLKALGNIHWAQGEFMEALQAYQQCLEFLPTDPNLRTKASILSNMAVVFETQGELENALNYEKKALAIRNETGGLNLANSHHVLGRIYYSRGDLNRAIQHFTTAFEITQSGRVKRTFSTNSLYLIQALVDNSKIFEAQQHLEQLIHDTESNFRSGQVIISLTKSIILKSNKNLQDLTQAQNLLQQLIREGNMSNFLLGLSYLHFTDTLLLEMDLFNTLTIFEKIKQNIHELLQIAKSQNSSILLIQTYFISSQLAVIDYDFEKAENHILLAQQLADDKGLRKLAIQASNLYDSLLEEISSKEQQLLDITKQHQASLQQRISKSQLSSLIRQIIQRKHYEDPSKIEEPVLLIITNREADIIYSFEFMEDKLSESEVLNLLQISTRTEQKPVSLEIQRFNYHQYKIIVKSTDNGMTFYYVFTGESYLAYLKLDIFVDILKTFQRIWKQLATESLQQLQNKKPLIDKIINEMYFNLQNEEQTIPVADIPQNLLEFKVLLNPVRLAMTKILYRNFKLTAAELRELVGISWGSYSSHKNALEKAGIITSFEEFVDETPRVMITLRAEGVTKYIKLKEALKAI